jgi:uncharacterized protein
VFLTPEGQPFFAGTYFPPQDRHGLPGFRRVLEAVSQTWREQREQVLTQGKRVVEAIARTSSLPESHEPLAEDLLRAAHSHLSQAFDPQWGGFGGAPKFPQPMTLEFLLRCHLRGYPDSLRMVLLTLDRMAAGGIRDHVGGGFHRYSVDDRWHVPHFEKMLYDNAQLARLYLHAWQVTGDDGCQAVAQDTLDYLLREMRHPEGGFYSSQDADSEGVEGKSYVWGWEELLEVAGEEVARFFGASPEGNWEEGPNILWLPKPGASPPAGVEEARRRLFEARERRVHPATDDKILASWNGLAIQALAEAGRALGESRYVEAASSAAGFILAELRREDGRLLRSWRDGRAGGPGYVDDYGMTAAACLGLYEATFDLRWMAEARLLADELIRLFHDPDRGGFFQTGEDAEPLVLRPKDLFDNAIPSGNSVATEVLLRLARLTGEDGYERAGLSALRVARNLIGRAPTMFGHALGALDLYVSPSKEVAVVGDLDSEETRQLIRAVWSRYLPNAVLAATAPGNEEAARLVPLLAGREPLDGKPAAYVCQRFTCKLPVSDPEALAGQLTA